MGINDLKRGSLVVIDSDPYLVMFVSHQHIGRGGASAQVRVKNLINAKIFDKTFKSSDELEEAIVSKMEAKFIYSRNDQYWFHKVGVPSNRFSINQDSIGEDRKFLKPEMLVRAVKFQDEFIKIELPIKAEYKVTEAPPNVKGNTAQGGNKQVTIETGAKITVPMFIETGETIKVNTQTEEYVERA